MCGKTLFRFTLRCVVVALRRGCFRAELSETTISVVATVCSDIVAIKILNGSVLTELRNNNACLTRVRRKYTTYLGIVGLG